MTAIDLKLRVSSRIFRENWDSDKFICVNRGGTRSSKTYTILNMAALYLFTGQIGTHYGVYERGVFSIIRKYSASLDKSALRDFEDILNQYDVLRHLKVNKTMKTYTLGNRVVQFMGADDPQKLRGVKHLVAYFNEANECMHEDFKQVAFRTEARIIVDFNPDDDQVWINTRIEQERASVMQDVHVIVSTYKDNPFLSKRQISEIEQMKITDPEGWQVFGLGNYGKIRGLIFQNIEVVSAVPEGAKLIGYGLDFGFTNDPTACVAVYQQEGALIVNELLYDFGLTNPDICSRLASIRGTGDIIADSAEPKSIEEIFRSGFNIYGALKGPDSVRNGIDILKRYKIKITAGSINLLSEVRRYKWKENKNEEKLNEPIDMYNHAIDALRYLALNKLGDHSRPTGNYTVWS